MTTNPLTATTGSGAQTNTASPQSVGQSVATGAQSSSVQPGTATSLLNGEGGVSLHSTALSTVNLDSPGAAPASIANQATPKPQHHVDSALLGFPALLVVVAIVLFWAVSRSGKTTT
jgi:hypothetical protein